MNSLPVGLLEGIWGHVPCGYLFARQTVITPKVFPTGDLTAIDGRGPTWAKQLHLVSRFSWELTSGKLWSKVWVQPASLSSICTEHFYVFLALIFVSLRSSRTYPFYRLGRCGQGGWVICQRTQINRRPGFNKPFWFSRTQWAFESWVPK